MRRHPAMAALASPLFLFRALAIAVALAAIRPAAAADVAPCGADAPCAVAEGSYHLAVPPGWDQTSPLPAIVFFHGHRSSGRSVIAGGSLLSEFATRGYLVIAPNGQPRRSPDVLGWPARPFAGEGRDDIAFTRAVIDDVAARLPLDRARIMVSGFSSGGSMAWLLACHDGARYAGVVALSGTLRRPVPQAGTCPSGPVRLLHIHGFADTQVPLEGRGIGDWHQGDAFEAMAILRRTNGCDSKPSSIVSDGLFGCRLWTGCASGRDVEMCIHGGGHTMPKGWAERARAFLEAEPGGS